MEIGTTQVYLDTDHSRVCVKDVEEQRGNYGYPETLGYRWLDQSEVFPFYELRAAAANVAEFKGNVAHASNVSAKAIEAQFATLKEKGKKFVVLSAFGCGAFGNDNKVIAKGYLQAIEKYKEYFKGGVIAFGIFNQDGIGKGTKLRLFSE